jgi:glycosyltransferase XagB
MTAIDSPMTQQEADDLRWSIFGLREIEPQGSATPTLIPAQKVILAVVLAIVVAAFVIAPLRALSLTMVVASAFYICFMIDRVFLFIRGTKGQSIMTISDEEARQVPDEELPIYTVLVPCYQETEIADRLVRGLGALEYPKSRLDVKLLLEADDDQTINAFLATEAASIAEVVLVPASEPRTKPKACNYGLLSARGEFVTIYDAEDIPDPLQLRRAVVAFERSPDDVACLQAKLAYHNDRQNMLTKWFTSEYDQWFGSFLVGLASTNSPIPLGGTSNHIRRDVLLEFGGWDAFNVTEDADLGFRLVRHGWRTGILDSTTLEEANSDPVNWVRQRSRWYKGYLQTYLVHVRSPLKLLRSVGWRAFLRMFEVTAGTPIAALLNVFFWGLTAAWVVGAPNLIRQIFPAYSFYPAAISLVLGNTAMVYLGLIAARQAQKPHLMVACVLVPIYWVLMSVAACKGMFQLIVSPSYWEKTVHGLDTHGHGATKVAP